MRFPGFTAEASLFKMEESYRLIGAWAGGSSGQAVIPQAATSCTSAGLGYCLYCGVGWLGLCTIAPWGSSACPTIGPCPAGSPAFC